MQATLEAPVSNITRLKIDNTDIFLEDLGEGKGKITVSDTYGHNYSMFWGAMGDSIKDFIIHINADYFIDKLLGKRSMQVFDAKKTLASFRKHIREEMGLPWYKHKDFQEGMRSDLNEFQELLEERKSEDYFVDGFYKMVERLPYHLISDSYDCKRVEDDFKSITEPWHFIQTKESQQSIWLRKLHAQIKKQLKSI